MKNIFNFVKNYRSMDYINIIKKAFAEEFKLFDRYLRDSIKTDNPRIMEIVDYVFKTDGKRVRPMLVFLTAQACGKISAATYHGAVTVELLHTATLIHDDVVDESKLRRGKPSVNDIFDNQRAVLCGDYFLSSALRESVKTQNLEIVDIIAQLGQNLSAGELNQYAIANEVIVDEKEYFRVIDEKTASLLHACAKIGAITAGAKREDVDKFGKLGTLLGLSFQIRDDIFDYYTSDVGKPTGNDIREGKITLPLIYALRNAPQEASDSMRKLIDKRDYSAENIEKLLSFAKEYKGVEYAHGKIDELLSEAETIIEALPFEKETESMMKLLIPYLKNRSF